MSTLSLVGLACLALAAVIVVAMIVRRRQRAAAVEASQPRTVADLVRLRAEQAAAAAASGPEHLVAADAPAAVPGSGSDVAEEREERAPEVVPEVVTAVVPEVVTAVVPAVPSSTPAPPEPSLTGPDTPWNRAARLLGEDPASTPMEFVPMRLVAPVGNADAADAATVASPPVWVEPGDPEDQHEDWTGWADWEEVDAQVDADGVSFGRGPEHPADDGEHADAAEVVGGEIADAKPAAGGGAPVAEPTADAAPTAPALAGGATAEAEGAAGVEAEPVAEPVVIEPVVVEPVVVEPVAVEPVVVEPAVAEPAVAESDAVEPVVVEPVVVEPVAVEPVVVEPVVVEPVVVEPVAVGPVADEPVVVEPTAAAGHSLPRWSAVERAAEQAAADLALVRTFGLSDPSVRPDSAPVVSLAGANSRAPEPVTGGFAQPVRFRVVGRDRAAVDGAAVTLFNDLGRDVSAATTDVAGRGELLAPQPGGYVLVVTARGHQPGAVALTVADAPADADVLLARSASISGTVYGEDGPIPGARVTLVQDGEVIDTVDTDSGGTYSIGDLAVGEYGLAVAAAGCQPLATLLDVPDETDLRHDVDLDAAEVPVDHLSVDEHVLSAQH